MYNIYIYEETILNATCLDSFNQFLSSELELQFLQDTVSKLQK